MSLRTRVGIGRHGAISRLAAGMADKEALHIDDPEFERLVVYTDDRQWAADLFADPQAREAILRLTNEETAAELRSLNITPNALLWQTRHLPVRYINPEKVRAWLDDLYELTRIAQGLTPPTVPAVESGLEHTTRTDRGKYTWLIIGITCGIFAAMAGCIIAISAVVIILAGSGF